MVSSVRRIMVKLAPPCMSPEMVGLLTEMRPMMNREAGGGGGWVGVFCGGSFWIRVQKIFRRLLQQKLGVESEVGSSG